MSAYRLTPRGMTALAASAALAGAGIGAWLSPTRASEPRAPYAVCVEAANAAPYAVEVCEPLAFDGEAARQESAREDDPFDELGCVRLGLNTFDCREINVW